MPVWIPEAAIRAIHRELMGEHGGLQGNTDPGALGATLARPRQLYHYEKTVPGLADLAAAYSFGFAKNHCFTDGNKRVALAVIDVFLQMNGHELIAPEEEAAVMIQALAASEMDDVELADWIAQNMAPLQEEIE